MNKTTIKWLGRYRTGVPDLAAGPTANGRAAVEMSTNGRGSMRADHVSYSYPSGTQALADVSLEVPPGSVVALVGPSGCGKTTLLHIFAGLMSPSAGSVDVSRVGPKGETDLTMVFQRDTLLPWLKVKDNVDLYRRLGPPIARGSSVDAEATRNELLKMVGLYEFRNSFPYQLSGGMRRRLAFIAAVAPRPSILLLDEPFSSVDEPSRVQIHQDIYRIISQVGTTVLLVTHDLAEALSLSDSIVMLTRGPGSVFRRYNLPFGRERNMLDLRQSPEFLERYSELWHDLSLQIGGRRGDA